MKTHFFTQMRTVAVLSLFCMCWAGQPAFAGVDRQALEKTMDAMATFDYGQNSVNLDLIRNAINESASQPEFRDQLESRFIQVIQTQSTRAAKDIACRNLGLIGTKKCVPAVTPLLSDPELSHMARYCLEKLAISEADAALREAMSKTTGPLKIGIISSLGARKDHDAVDLLAAALNDPTAGVAEAAANALGNIGTKTAANALMQAAQSAHAPLQDSEIQASLLAADKLRLTEDNKTALEIFKVVYLNQLHLEHPERHQPAALAGLIRTAPQAEEMYLLPALSGTNIALQQTAAILASETQVKLKPLLAALPTLPSTGQKVLLHALSARSEHEIKLTVLPFLDSKSLEVTSAALEALKSRLDATDIPTLARFTVSQSDSIKQTAFKTLVKMNGSNVNTFIVKELTNENTAIRVQLFNTLAARSATETIPAIASKLNDAQQSVRLAVLKALETLSDESQLSTIIQHGIKTTSEEERTAAFATIRSICERTRGKALDAVQAGMNQAGEKLQPQFFALLASIGGNRGLESVLKTVNASTPSELQSAAVRSLADWSTLDAAPHLMSLIQKSQTNALRTLAFRGYVRLVQESEIAETNKVAYFSQAVATAQSVDEKQLVLGALGEMSSPDALSLANRFTQDETVAQEAGFACVGIIGKFNDAQKAEATPVLKSLLHSSKNASLLESVRKQMTRLGITE